MLEDEQLPALGPWAKGVNNVDKENSIGADELRSAVNIDLDRQGNPRRRAGLTQRVELTDGHSVYSNSNLLVGCDGGTLYRIDPNLYSTTSLRSDLVPNRSLSYCDIQGSIYYSNGIQTGRILPDGSLMGLGVSVPNSPTLASASNGSLYAGSYQVCLTNVNSAGEESGSTLANVVTIASDGGTIQITDIPQASGVSYVRIYATPPNGDTFYRHVEIPIGVTSYNLTTTIRGPVLETQFGEPMPGGHIIRYYRGRLYSADESVVWFSEPLRYGLCKPLDDHLPDFGERITVMQPVHDGIYVVADKAYFLGGNNPHEMIPVVAHPHRGIEGTGIEVAPKMFNAEEVPGMLAYWFSENGPCLGFPGGLVSPPTEDRIAHAAYASGASGFRQVEGIRSVVTSLRGKGSGSGFAASDSLTFEVRRNGVLVE